MCGLGLGLGLEASGLGLGLGLEPPGLGLGLGLQPPGLGLGLGLGPPGLDYKSADVCEEVVKYDPELVQINASKAEVSQSNKYCTISCDNTIQ